MKKGPVREWFDALLFAVIAATLIRWATFEAFTIPTPSMEKSLLVGDFLFVNKLNYGPRTPKTPLQVPLTHQKIWGTDIQSYLDWIQLPTFRLPGFGEVERNDVVVAISQSGTTKALIESVKIVRKNGAKVIGIMPGETPLANICDFPLTINVGINNRISKPVTSRIAYTAVIDVLTMGVAQLKPEAQDHLYNIADSQRSLKIDN